MIGRRLQTGSRANCTIHIGSQTTVAADNMMVVVSHPRLVASRMAGRLDAPDQAGFLQNMQIIVHGLERERPKPLAGNISNGFRIPMLPFALDRQEYGETGCGYSQTDRLKGFVNCDFVGGHLDYYRRLIWNESIVRTIPFWIVSVSYWKGINTI